ncbi:hypothetical protein [Algoriphagus sp. CAU 1675]|uniref:hypothetical protein n=1 Tax=Algoriphagus sp. CAU 1675 TaxID=3032597 RepID=UPI0023D9FBD0|nr:hypothetical protein [Algoriphagus sp. CAU 1675]MDF2156275.1 hypothetical protein [Algoriphagus sp. CAU 1675]
MLEFFKVNDPFRLIGVGIYFLITTFLYLVFGQLPITSPQLDWMLLGERLGDGYFLYQDIIDDTGPFSAGFFFLVDFIFGRSPLIYEILGRILIFFQIYYWNRILIRYKVFDENTYVPSIVMLALFHFGFDMLSISPALLGSTFLLLALGHLFSQTVIQKDGSESTLLIGIYGGLATGFHPIYVVFLPFMIFAGIVVSGFSFRQLMLSLVGYFLPILLMSVFYFWKDSLDEAITIWPLIFFSEKYHYQSYLDWAILGTFPLILSLVGYFYTSLLRASTINQQKQRQLILIWLLFAIAGIFIAKREASFQLVILTPILSYLITQFFLNVRKAPVLRIAFFLLVIGLPVASWWYWEKKSQENTGYFVQGPEKTSNTKQPLLVLGNDRSPYLNGSLDGPFLNFNLSKLYLSQERDLPQRARLFRMIEKQKPKLILDQEGVFAKILEDYPELSRQYQMTSPGVYSLK